MEWAQSWMPDRHKQQQLLSDSRASPSHGYCSQCSPSTSIYWSSPSLWAALCPTQVSRLPEQQMWATIQQLSATVGARPLEMCPSGNSGWAGDALLSTVFLSQLPASQWSGPLCCFLATVRWPCRLFKFLMHRESMWLIYLHKHVTFYIIKLKSIQIQSEVPFLLFLKATIIHGRYFYWVKTQILTFVMSLPPQK